MAKNKQPELTYEEREALDKQFESAVADILSAEREAKAIVEQAGESVRAIAADGAARERAMRDDASKAIASARAAALTDAEARGEMEANRIKNEAKERGEKLVASKQKDIKKIAAELFGTL